MLSVTDKMHRVPQHKTLCTKHFKRTKRKMHQPISNRKRGGKQRKRSAQHIICLHVYCTCMWYLYIMPLIIIIGCSSNSLSNVFVVVVVVVVSSSFFLLFTTLFAYLLLYYIIFFSLTIFFRLFWCTLWAVFFLLLVTLILCYIANS